MAGQRTFAVGWCIPVFPTDFFDCMGFLTRFVLPDGRGPEPCLTLGAYFMCVSPSH
jgi:hypothetical protein